MNKYKVVIVDDDEVAIGKLSDALKKNPRFSIEGTARNDKQGKKLIVKIQPDLLFLDVEMSDSSSDDTAATLTSCCVHSNDTNMKASATTKPINNQEPL